MFCSLIGNASEDASHMYFTSPSSFTPASTPRDPKRMFSNYVSQFSKFSHEKESWNPEKQNIVDKIRNQYKGNKIRNTLLIEYLKTRTLFEIRITPQARSIMSSLNDFC